MATSKAIVLALAALSFVGVNAGPCRISSTTTETTLSSSMSVTPTTTASSTLSTTASTTSSAPNCVLTIALEHPVTQNIERRQSLICGRKGLIGNSSPQIKDFTGLSIEECAYKCSITEGCSSIVNDGNGWCSLNSGPAVNLQIDTSVPAAFFFDLACFSCVSPTSFSSAPSSTITSYSTPSLESTSTTTPTTTPAISSSTSTTPVTPTCSVPTMSQPQKRVDGGNTPTLPSYCRSEGYITRYDSGTELYRDMSGITVEQCADECAKRAGCETIVWKQDFLCQLFKEAVDDLWYVSSDNNFFIYQMECFECTANGSPYVRPTLTTTPASSSTYAPICTATTIPDDPSPLTNLGFDESTLIGGETVYGYPWTSINGNIQKATSSLHAHNNDYFFYTENPSEDSPGSVKQSVSLEPRVPYDLTLWYALHALSPSTEGCIFTVSEPSNLHLGGYRVDFSQTGTLTIDTYYQVSMTFESLFNTNLELMLSVYCHGEYDQTPADSTVLIDDLTMKKSPRVCGPRGVANNGNGKNIGIEMINNLDGLGRCVDLCSQTTDCMTISYNGRYCNLWNSNAFELQVAPATSDSVWYEMACFDCPTTATPPPPVTS